MRSDTENAQNPGSQRVRDYVTSPITEPELWDLDLTPKDGTCTVHLVNVWCGERPLHAGSYKNDPLGGIFMKRLVCLRCNQRRAMSAQENEPDPLEVEHDEEPEEDVLGDRRNRRRRSVWDEETPFLRRSEFRRAWRPVLEFLLPRDIGTMMTAAIGLQTVVTVEDLRRPREYAFFCPTLCLKNPEDCLEASRTVLPSSVMSLDILGAPAGSKWIRELWTDVVDFVGSLCQLRSVRFRGCWPHLKTKKERRQMLKTFNTMLYSCGPNLRQLRIVDVPTSVGTEAWDTVFNATECAPMLHVLGVDGSVPECSWTSVQVRQIATLIPAHLRLETGRLMWQGGLHKTLANWKVARGLKAAVPDVQAMVAKRSPFELAYCGMPQLRHLALKPPADTKHFEATFDRLWYETQVLLDFDDEKEWLDTVISHDMPLNSVLARAASSLDVLTVVAEIASDRKHSFVLTKLGSWFRSGSHFPAFRILLPHLRRNSWSDCQEEAQAVSKGILTLWSLTAKGLKAIDDAVLSGVSIAKGLTVKSEETSAVPTVATLCSKLMKRAIGAGQTEAYLQYSSEIGQLSQSNRHMTQPSTRALIEITSSILLPSEGMPLQGGCAYGVMKVVLAQLEEVFQGDLNYKKKITDLSSTPDYRMIASSRLILDADSRKKVQTLLAMYPVAGTQCPLVTVSSTEPNSEEEQFWKDEEKRRQKAQEAKEAKEAEVKEPEEDASFSLLELGREKRTRAALDAKLKEHRLTEEILNPIVMSI